ncbi:signal recognition particle 54 kDa protein 2 [Iris pallida]|uniref:Signal recognition particle 54 kDa protein 2 n=1 Tax=Iris pallida TaxID=29817 RepID=A0AAX6G0N2_IRIPA|nr:signal recognition particle 54 kDa protein 2 [Iris pallida]
MSSNPSGTQAPPPSKDKRYLLHIEANGVIRGKDETKWSSRCGKYIRAHIPIGYDDWRNVDKVYTDALWNSLMTEFEFNIDPILARPLLEAKFPQFLRTMKYHLRATIKNKEGIYLPKPLALAQCPDDIDKIWWEKFIENEYTPKKIEQRKKNAENKAQCKISHALGRKSYKRVYEELEEEHPAEGVTRSEAWKRAHKSKATGSVLPCALEKYNELEAAEKRQKEAASASGHDGVSSLEDLETDPIAEVFGVDKKSRCRTVSSTSSVKQVKIRQAAKAIASKNTNPEVLQRLDVVEVMLRELLTRGDATHQPQNPTFASGTPETEGASNSVHISKTTGNLNPILNTVGRVPSNNNNSHVVHGNKNNGHVVHDNNDGPAHGGKQNVILLGREREDVAKGFIASHTTCHGRKVQDDEKIVYVSEVIKPEATVYDGPQDGISFLCEIADGGFLVWGAKRLRYL